MRKWIVTALTVCAVSVSAQAPWPMERQDRHGTGRALVGPSPNSYVAPYIFKVLSNGKPVSHGPAINVGNVGYYGDWVNNTLYKFDTKTGAILSSFPDGRFVTSSPAIGPHPYVAYATDGLVRSLNITNMTSAWFLETGYIGGSPTIGPDGDVVFCTVSGTVQRRDAASGAVVWEKGAFSAGRGTVVFSRDNLNIYVSHGTKISSLKYSDGTTNWTRELNSPAGAPAVAPNNLVLVGADNGLILALQPGDASIAWFKQTGGEVRAAAGFGSDGTAYVGSYDGKLYSLNSTSGATNWFFQSSLWLVSPPSIGADGRIYFHNKAGELFAVNPNGSQSWKMNLPGESRGPLSIGPDGTLFVGFTGNNGTGLAMIKQVVPLLLSLRVAPSTVISGTSTGGVLKLDSPAPAGGATVSMSSNSSVLKPPPTVTVPAGSDEALFTIETGLVTATASRVVSATLGSVTKSATVTLTPGLQSVTVSPTSVPGGSNATGTARLYGNAPAGGASVQLTDNTSVISTPPSVSIAQATQQATFTVSTSPVTSNVTRQIYGTLGSVKRTANLTLTPAHALVSLTMNPSTVQGGQGSTGTVTMSSPAPAGGDTVALTDNTSVINTPPSVFIGGGASTGAFQVTTSAVGATATRQVSASFNGVTKTANLTLTP